MTPPICNIPDYRGASRDRTQSNIEYLQRHGGECGAAAGPKICTRVACQYSSAIFVCNDNDHAVGPHCSDVVDLAQDILNSCTYRNGRNHETQGQEFNTDGWNVVIGQQHC
jgi:hypothetical protein